MSRRLRFQAQEAKQSRRRWNSSMFDDLDSAVSAPEAPAGVQGTVDEQLIEQVLQEAEESGNKGIRRGRIR